MKRLILCDFDGTISLLDIGYALASSLPREAWKTIEQDFDQGKIGSREAYVRIAHQLKGDEASALRFVREHSAIDPHFPSFYRYCREKDIDVKIISDGLDFYIRAFLEMHGLSEIPFHANCARFLNGGGMDISFPHSNDECGLCGTCKKRLVQIHRGQYDSILFVGNGLSDRCGAEAADFTFAKDSLYDYCIDSDITCHYYEGFCQILADLKKRINGIIFDLDGTLIDAHEAIYLGLKEAFKQSGKKIFPFREFRNYLKADLETTLLQFFSPEEVRKSIPVMRKKYAEVYITHTRWLDGAREVIETLHARGVRMGVASNKHGLFSRETLNHLGISHCFRSVIGGGDVARNKPFPDMIHAALSEMGLAHEEAVFVGDTLTDIEAGKRAGVDVFALSTGFHTRKELSLLKPKRMLRSLKEVPFVQQNLFYSEKPPLSFQPLFS